MGMTFSAGITWLRPRIGTSSTSMGQSSRVRSMVFATTNSFMIVGFLRRSAQPRIHYQLS